jgi:cation diffusion facilitator CzcD-associated flavoprotein CzcO
VRVVVVGAGFSGVAVTRELLRAGITDVVVLERASDLGGVWFHNSYPGAACDVQSYVYSYSWATRRDWSRPCSPGPEIQQYLREVAEREGVLEKVRFGVEVESADFDEAALKWRLRSSGGEAFEADALVLACGQLSRPKVPEIPGMEDFGGHAFHSAEWDHAHDLAGRRVAVVGTGASAIQFVPHVAQQAARTTVFQRTAPWLLPRANPQYPRWVVEAIRRVPGVQRFRRHGTQLYMELLNAALSYSALLRKPTEWWSKAFMRHQLRDHPELREKVWPTEPMGCKRILFSSCWLPTLARPDVDVVNDAIAGITERGIVTADGREHEADTIIWGTGFRADEFVLPMAVHGLGGEELQEAWREGPEAHLGICVSGFPSMFLTYGPNTNLGGGSIIAMIEGQAGWIRQALVHLRATGAAALDVRPEVQRASAARVQAKLRRSVWAQCESWYRLGGDGRITHNWPGLITEYRRATRTFRPADVRLLHRAARPAATAPAA